jgi:murein L,D-transpeptidase YcbB/YkuD
VPILRRRLQITGDITIQDPNSFRYDAGLELAVRGFQARQGLEVDGVVGPASRAALNLPVGERIAQLLINLERWRWLPDDLGDRHVLVNIAGFELQAVDYGQTVFRSAVVVGTPYHQTPVFSDQIEYVEFNPFWNVPTSIARGEILPKARRDPGYLAQQNIRVLAGWGDDAPVVDPRRIDWSRPFPYRLRQEPGPNNALGRVKIMFPNPFNVYLHDTPARDLFGRASRAFSHGCIRVHEPLALAAHVLDWSLPQVQSVVDGRGRKIVRLAKPMPVHVTYQTAWVGQDGAVQFREDIYGRDARVADLLFRPS